MVSKAFALLDRPTVKNLCFEIPTLNKLKLIDFGFFVESLAICLLKQLYKIK